MKVIKALAALGILAAGSSGHGSFGCAAASGRQVRGAPRSAPAATQLYDPARNPERDLGDAIIQASWSGKRILIEVGGDWCIWCHRLEAFVAKDRALVRLRDSNFIVVKVNHSPENTNEVFLSNYPKIPGFPHIFVLSPDGKLLCSQRTSELEHGESYDRQRVAAFLKKWAPT
jgi:thiol:disulfide interchange protein